MDEVRMVFSTMADRAARFRTVRAMASFPVGGGTWTSSVALRRFEKIYYGRGESVQGRRAVPFCPRKFSEVFPRVSTVRNGCRDRRRRGVRKTRFRCFSRLFSFRIPSCHRSGRRRRVFFMDASVARSDTCCIPVGRGRKRARFRRGVAPPWRCPGTVFRATPSVRFRNQGIGIDRFTFVCWIIVADACGMGTRLVRSAFVGFATGRRTGVENADGLSQGWDGVMTVGMTLAAIVIRRGIVLRGRSSVMHRAGFWCNQWRDG